MKVSKGFLSKEARESLDKMTKATNEKFTIGRVTKRELLSWVILRFERDAFEKSMDEIRKAHVDELMCLNFMVSQVRLAKKAGSSPPDLKLLKKSLAEFQFGEKLDQELDTGSAGQGTEKP